jgi:hypothetical protein
MVRKGELSGTVKGQERSGTVNGQERSGTVNGQERSGTVNGQERSYCTRSRSVTFTKSPSVILLRDFATNVHAPKTKELL